MSDGAERREAAAQAQKFIEQRLAALLNEALQEECLFFKCQVQYGNRALALQIAFSDGVGRLYRRTLSCSRFFTDRDIPFRLEDALDLLSRIESRLVNTDGFQPSRVYTLRKR
jgi:hypothetical protein